MNTDTLFLFESFYESHPELFREGPLLIAGVKTSREVAISQRFTQLGQKVLIAEPWMENAKIAKRLHPHAEVLVQPVETMFSHVGVKALPNGDDIRTFVWLQGPEHVATAEVKSLLRSLMETASLIVLEMPHGIHHQGPDGGNNYEEHVSHWFTRDFSDLGDGWTIYTSHDGRPCDEVQENRHLLAVWRKP